MAGPYDTLYVSSFNASSISTGYLFADAVNINKASLSSIQFISTLLFQDSNTTSLFSMGLQTNKTDTFPQGNVNSSTTALSLAAPNTNFGLYVGVNDSGVAYIVNLSSSDTPFSTLALLAEDVVISSLLVSSINGQLPGSGSVGPELAVSTLTASTISTGSITTEHASVSSFIVSSINGQAPGFVSPNLVLSTLQVSSILLSEFALQVSTASTVIAAYALGDTQAVVGLQPQSQSVTLTADNTTSTFTIQQAIDGSPTGSIQFTPSSLLISSTDVFIPTHLFTSSLIVSSINGQQPGGGSVGPNLELSTLAVSSVSSVFINTDVLNANVLNVSSIPGSNIQAFSLPWSKMQQTGNLTVYAGTWTHGGTLSVSNLSVSSSYTVNDLRAKSMLVDTTAVVCSIIAPAISTIFISAASAYFDGINFDTANGNTLNISNVNVGTYTFTNLDARNIGASTATLSSLITNTVIASSIYLKDFTTGSANLLKVDNGLLYLNGSNIQAGGATPAFSSLTLSSITAAQGISTVTISTGSIYANSISTYSMSVYGPNTLTVSGNAYFTKEIVMSSLIITGQLQISTPGTNTFDTANATISSLTVSSINGSAYTPGGGGGGTVTNTYSTLFTSSFDTSTITLLDQSNTTTSATLSNYNAILYFNTYQMINSLNLTSTVESLLGQISTLSTALSIAKLNVQSF